MKLPTPEVIFRRSSIPLLISILLTAGFGIFLRGTPSAPNGIFEAYRAGGVFLFFVSFLLCLLGWGRVITQLLGLEKWGLLGYLSLGSAWGSGIGLTLGHLGKIGFEDAPLSSLLLVSGVLLSLSIEIFGKNRKKISAGNLLEMISKLRIFISQASKSPFSVLKFFQFLFLVLFLLMAIWVLAGYLARASLMNGTTDPFTYHLLGPRMWAEYGKIYLPESIPIVFQATTWEMLILLGIQLLGGPQGGGLIEGQLFGQYLHVFLGVGGSWLAIQKLFIIRNKSQLWIPAIFLGTLLSKELNLVAALAKNDWGGIFWVLSGAVFLLRSEADLFERESERNKELLISGVLFGLAVSAKLNQAFFFGSLILVWSLVHAWNQGFRFTGAQLSKVLISFGITMLPISIRNWMATGNPIYPVLGSWTRPELMTPLESSFMASHPVHLEISFSFLRENFFRLVTDHPVHLSLFILPFFILLFSIPPFSRLLFFKEFFRETSHRILIVSASLGASWMFYLEVPNFFTRWVGAPLVLSGALSVAAVGQMLRQMSRLLSKQKLGLLPKVSQEVSEVLLCLLVTLFLMRETWPASAWTGLFQQNPLSEVIRHPRVHPGGDSKAWLHANVSVTSPIFSTGDDLLYYAQPLQISSIQDDSRVAKEIEFIRDPIYLVRKLRDLGFEYVLDTDYWAQPYWTLQSFLLDQMAFPHPEGIVFIGPNSKVIDLRVLEESLKVQCVPKKNLLQLGAINTI